MSAWVSRGGEKLEAALRAWSHLLPPLQGLVAADFGSNVGGFVQCLLAHGVGKVYALDTGYGVLAWSLRQDARVIVMERTNALHVALPEPVDLVTADMGWTRQKYLLPAAWRLLRPGGPIISLVKPHYEAEASERRRGVLNPEALPGVLERVRRDVADAGGEIVAEMESPLKGGGGNVEYLWLMRKRA